MISVDLDIEYMLATFFICDIGTILTFVYTKKSHLRPSLLIVLLYTKIYLTFGNIILNCHKKRCKLSMYIAIKDERLQIIE